MKNSFIRLSFLPIIILIFHLFLNFRLSNDNRFDEAPNASYQKNVPSANFNYPIKWNFHYFNIPGLNFGTVGAVYFKGKYYLNTWNSANTCYTLNGTGAANSPDLNTLDSIKYPIYTGGIRDMAIGKDGSGKNFLWGGKAGNVLFKMDSTLEVRSQFTIPGASFRAIAWDPNRKGFWNCSFTGNIICHDTLGNIKGTLTSGSVMTGKYGLAWDSVTSGDSAFLWIWNQGGGFNSLYKIHLGSGNIVANYQIELYSGSFAGGANIIKYGNTNLLLLNFQSTALVCYLMTGYINPDCGVSYNRNNISKQIPDNEEIYDTLNVKDYSGTPDYINVVLDTIYHTWVGDLTMTLSHEGITDTLMHRPGNAFGNTFGSSGDHFIGTRLRDDGTIRMDSITAGMQPLTSPPNFKPGTKYGMDSLSKFRGTDPNGDWVLKIRDNVPGDKGMLEAWHLCMGRTIVGIPGNQTLAKNYSLSQNYPNPFNPETRIEYSIAKQGFVSIIVYDIMGREIIELEGKVKSSGTHFINFDGSGFSSGIYFYRIRVNEFVETKRMILLK